MIEFYVCVMSSLYRIDKYRNRMSISMKFEFIGISRTGFDLMRHERLPWDPFRNSVAAYESIAKRDCP